MRYAPDEELIERIAELEKENAKLQDPFLTVYKERISVLEKENAKFREEVFELREQTACDSVYISELKKRLNSDLSKLLSSSNNSRR